MTCPKITRIWFGSQLNLRIMDQPISNFQDWITHAILNNSEDVLIQIAGLVYYIWFARNLSIYEDKDLLEDEIIQRASEVYMTINRQGLQLIYLVTPFSLLIQ